MAKHRVFCAAVAAAALICPPLTSADTGAADTPEATAAPPATIVCMEIVPTPTPEPIPLTAAVRQSMYVRTYTEADVEMLAGIMWVSPCNRGITKRVFGETVLNRVDCKAWDAAGNLLFGNTIESVINSGEYDYLYRGNDGKTHLSETNLTIARELLADWAGGLIGWHIPEDGVYVDFVGSPEPRDVQVLDLGKQPVYSTLEK